MQMEADLSVLRQQVRTLEGLYEALPRSVTEGIVDQGGPAGRVDR
ncbi:MAG TPA: hypothetical protein VIA06_04965 [Candidatus Dormibacteraeota bacterium]|nr:hypothetical protein [Candidatus Dormibacteraeota bacterium]